MYACMYVCMYMRHLCQCQLEKNCTGWCGSLCATYVITAVRTLSGATAGLHDGYAQRRIPLRRDGRRLHVCMSASVSTRAEAGRVAPLTDRTKPTPPLRAHTLTKLLCTCARDFHFSVQATCFGLAPLSLASIMPGFMTRVGWG